MRPLDTSGVFRSPRVGLVADWVQLAQELRTLTDPAVAAVLLFPRPDSSALSAVASASRVEQGHTRALSLWLENTEDPSTNVPPELRRVLSCFKVWLLPIATPGACYGMVALPALNGSETQQRRVASVVCDFALRLEGAERTRVLKRLHSEELMAGHIRLTSMPANGLKYA
jgi:hypothetical protein